MFCGYCGKQVDDGSAFCPFCGSKMVEIEEQPFADYGQQGYAQYDQQQAYVQYDQQYDQQYYDQQQAYGQYDQHYGGQFYDQQQAYAQYEQQHGAQPYAGADAYAYGGGISPVRASAPDVPKTAKGTSWPVACGVTGIIAMIILLVGMFIPLAFDGNVMFNNPVALIVFALMIAEFFAPTKKIPWVTIIPFAVYVIAEIVAQFYALRSLISLFGQSWAVTSEILYMVIPVILLIFYVLNMAIRPKGTALKVFFVIFMIIEIILLLISVYSLIYQGISYSAGNYILVPLFTRLAFIFFYIGHGVAVLSVRK